jgi:sugar/nucleoside kinase (ribokinase family)
MEDLNDDEDAAREMALHCNVLAVTRAAQGASLYWQGQRSDLPGLNVAEIDSTGSGDIFAAAFFIRLRETDNPIEAGQFANTVAAASITRRGVQSTPTPAELKLAKCRIHQ